MSDLRIEFDRSDLMRLHRMQQQLPNFLHEGKLKQSVGQLLSSQAKLNIQEGTPDGTTSYALLKPSTVKNKGFSKPLIGARTKGTQNGALLRSISFSPGDRDTIYLTAMDYAKYHQFKDRGKSTAPQRKIFSIRKENMVDIMHFITKSFSRQIQKFSK